MFNFNINLNPLSINPIEANPISGGHSSIESSENVFIVDDLGNYIVDDLGNYLVTGD